MLLNYIIEFLNTSALLLILGPFIILLFIRMNISDPKNSIMIVN
jgi:hypothetical protein